MTFEVWLRLSAFLLVLLLCALFEWRLPRRSWRFPKHSRWLTNLTLTLLNTVLARLTLGAFAITAAIWASDQDIGLFNQVAAPQWLILLIGAVVLDAAVWLQHRVTHRVPLLWRLHRVHHTDPELDVTTALRFHPVEIGLSLLWKALVVILLGLTPAAVILFELLLSISAIFTHANLRLPAGLDRRLRWLICTPDMHRIHHSVYQPETDSNYGFFLSIWDRAFGSYRHQPADGVEQMRLGLLEFTEPRELTLGHLLLQPLKNIKRINDNGPFEKPDRPVS